MKPSGSCVPLLSCARRSWRYPSSADHSALCLARQAIPSSRLPKGFCCRSKPADTLSRAPITRPFPLQERSSLDSPLEGDGFELVVPRGDRASVSRLRRFVDQFLARGNRWFADSLLEGDGFELLVPRHKSRGFPCRSSGCWRSAAGRAPPSGHTVAISSACML